MEGWEVERLLKMKGTYPREYKYAFTFHNDEGTFTFHLLLHDRYGHINYDIIFLLKRNGVFGFPTITKNLRDFDARIIGEHHK